MSELWSATAEGQTTSPYEGDSVTLEGSNTFAPSAEQANAGSQSYKVSYDGSNEGAYLLKSVSDQTYLYLKVAVYVPSDFTLSAEWRAHSFIGVYDGGSFIAHVCLHTQTSTTPTHWQSRHRDGSLVASDTNFSTNTWHEIEIELDATNGTYKTWADGDLINDQSGMSYSLTMDRVRVGGVDLSAPVSGSSLYIDDVYVYDSEPVSGITATGSIGMEDNTVSGTATVTQPSGTASGSIGMEELGVAGFAFTIYSFSDLDIFTAFEATCEDKDTSLPYTKKTGGWVVAQSPYSK